MSEGERQVQPERGSVRPPNHETGTAPPIGTGLPRTSKPQLHAAPNTLRVGASPQRAFCQPFEDLLVDLVPAMKQKGRISRASIAPVWRWLENDLIPSRHKAFCEEIARAMHSGQSALLQAKRTELWGLAAAAIRAALATPEKKSAARAKLGSAIAADDALEMALLVSAGTDLLVLLQDLPRPIKSLGPREIAILRGAYDQLIKRQPDLAPYVAVIAMARLERPWEALHLAAIIARASNDAVISNTDMGIVGELLFSDLDRHAAVIAAARPVHFDPDTLLPALAAFADLSAGMVKELGIRRDGKWGQHLTKARATVSAAMENLLARAPKEIAAALPASRPGGHAKGLDLSHPPVAERLVRAERYARIVGGAQPYASAAAFNAKLGGVRTDGTAVLRRVAEELLRELRSAPPGPYAGLHLTALLDIASPILGEEETLLLRRRARAAAH
jgi:hypothetical protein